jgi:pilus assembly protein Flp/PilA
MNRIIAIVSRLRRAAGDARGTTAIEYALVAGGIALAIISAVGTVGETLKENFYDKLAAMF